MKKIRLSLIVASALLALSACGDKKDAPPTTPVAVTPDASVAVKEAKTNEELYKAALEFTGFMAGGESKGVTSNPEVIVFFDPQCPHCGTFWNSTRVLKDVKMKWIPVSILNQKSMIDSTHILASANPVETMTLHERLLDDNKGGLQETNAVDAFKDKVTANTDFFAVNMKGVPSVVYRNSAGEYGTFTGAVPVDELMKALKITSVTLETTDNSGTPATEVKPEGEATPTTDTGTVTPSPSVVEGVKAEVTEAVDATKEGASKATEAVKDGTVKAVESVKEETAKVVDATKEGASKVGEAIKTEVKKLESK